MGEQSEINEIQIMEVWKPVVGCEGLYIISNTGRLKSFRKCGKGSKSLRDIPVEINGTIRPDGYKVASLFGKNRLFHQMVAESFLGYDVNNPKYIADHIDTNKMNNRLDNIQVITFRENCTKDKKPESGIHGVYLSTDKKKWRSRLYVNGRTISLGSFTTKDEARIFRDSYIKRHNL